LSLLFVYGHDVALRGPRTSLPYLLKWHLFLEPPTGRSAQYMPVKKKTKTSLIGHTSELSTYRYGTRLSAFRNKFPFTAGNLPASLQKR